MKVAQIDVDGVYLGQVEIDQDDFDPIIHVDATEYGGSCDLKTGKRDPKYRWDKLAKRFDPIHTEQEQLARAAQKIIEFAAEHAVGKVPEIDALLKEHFPAEHRLARVKAK